VTSPLHGGNRSVSGSDSIHQILDDGLDTLTKITKWTVPPVKLAASHSGPQNLDVVRNSTNTFPKVSTFIIFCDRNVSDTTSA
jgi:hypothetical protein